MSKTLFLLTGFICLFLTGWQCLHPYNYIRSVMPTEQGYVEGQTSGYGIPEAIAYLREQGGKGRLLVGTAMNTGNPESAMIVAFHKIPVIQTAYVDAASLGGDLSSIDCIRFNIPAYFVARNEETGDLTRFLHKERVFPKPSGKDVITVYSFIRDCPDKALPIAVPEKI